MFLIALALMLFTGATLLDTTAVRVLVLLVAIVLTAALLTAMLASLVTLLLALSTVTTLLLAANVGIVSRNHGRRRAFLHEY